MTTSEYVPSRQSRLVSPLGKPDAARMMKMSSMASPRTITLGNQSEAILRGMASEHAPLTHGREHLFTQTQRQPPLLPNAFVLGEPSRPIRISRRKSTDFPRLANNQSEDALSASPTELKMMYDEATWRMYNLIQTARLEKQAAKAAQGDWPSTDNDNANDEKYVYGDSFTFLPSRTPPQSNHPAVIMPDEPEHDEHGEEGVFEFDDL